MAAAVGVADAEATPPPLHGVPDAKEKKYDRQLRLWAKSGQEALEQAHILLVNSSPGVTGVETLKNLVLPGIGQYTILDSALVSEADLGVNFFLDESCLGGFRAEHTCRLLQELNPDVKGHFLTEPVESFINKPNSLQPYTLLLVAAPISPDVLDSISSYAQQHHIPLFYLHSVGFYSHFELALPPAFPIVDTHPDPASTTDLRLMSPWPALNAFVDEKTADLKSLSEHDLGHVPYVLLLLHFLKQWRSDHENKLPTAYKEKTEFRSVVQSAAPSPDEENFAEAAAAVLKTLNLPTPTSSVLAVLNAPEADDLHTGSASFWYMAKAIHKFYLEHNELPLPGALPDMKAKSADYIQLQNIYKSKAREDFAEVLSTVRALEKSLNRPGPPIDEKEVEAFCKGAAHAKLVRGRPIVVARSEKSTEWGSQAKSVVNALSMPDSGVRLALAFLAWDVFVASHDRVPGHSDDDVDADAEKLGGIAHKIMDDAIKQAGTTVDHPEYSSMKEELSKVAMELARAGSTELHNIAALTGGMIAQEVIKVITKQYVPIDNTCVFDGIDSKAAVLRM